MPMLAFACWCLHPPRDHDSSAVGSREEIPAPRFNLAIEFRGNSVKDNPICRVTRPPAACPGAPWAGIEGAAACGSCGSTCVHLPRTLPSRMRDDWLGWCGRCLLGMLVVISAVSADVRSPVELSGGASAKAALHNMARARLAKVAAASCVPPPRHTACGGSAGEARPSPAHACAGENSSRMHRAAGPCARVRSVLVFQGDSC